MIPTKRCGLSRRFFFSTGGAFTKPLHLLLAPMNLGRLVFPLPPPLCYLQRIQPMATTPLSSADFRRVVGNFATGITVLTVERDPGQVHGMTANSFASVSLDPLLILVCIDNNARLLSFLTEQRRFGVNILKASQQAVSEHFAKPLQDPEATKSLGIHFCWTSSGIPILQDALAHLACNVAGQYPAGDHTLFLGEVESMACSPGEPLLYHRGRYRQLQP
jgi:flavin reductase (DIM6/NTAB) family NADH-FMN oxidoreductase RutF